MIQQKCEYCQGELVTVKGELICTNCGLINKSSLENKERYISPIFYQERKLKQQRLYKQKNGKFEDTKKHRGSLFSHQELAIATFLEIGALSFREKNVKEKDGILEFIQANCVKFTDRHLLPDVVAEKIREQEWNPNWRNELLLERDDGDFGDVRFVGREERPARFYHIKV